MVELWMNQVRHLSVAQSVFLLLLCCVIVGLMLAYYQMEGTDDV